jgi:hypothetical protein
MRGGHRYGAGRPGWRRRCEHMLSLDVRVLRRKGRLVDGQRFNWSWRLGDEPSGSMGVSVHETCLVLDYVWTPRGHEGRNHRCTVYFQRTPCRFGGHRIWFTCPDCARTCAVVYGPSRRGNFACRVCQRLGYMSESQSPIDRCWRAQRKLEAKLGEEGTRPKGMRQRTFERINARWDQIEERKDDLWGWQFARLAASLGMGLD